MFKKALLSCTIATSMIFSQTPRSSWERDFSPIFDINFTPYAGASNLMSLHHGMERLEDAVFEPVYSTEIDSKVPTPYPALTKTSRWGRQARSLLFWLPESSALVVTQHEVFGHGYRIRDLGGKYCKVSGYQIFPFSGATNFLFSSQLTTSQNLAISIAGVEASSVLASQVRQSWLSEGMVDPRQTLVYYFSALDVTGYSWTLRQTPHAFPRTGNDMTNYLFYLNATYPDAHLSCRSLRNQSLINLLDPFIFYSLYTMSIYNRADVPATKTPMIDFGAFKYLPAVRFELTPFGPQYYFHSFFLKDLSPTCCYLKWGQHGVNTYYGVGVENRALFMLERATFGFKMDLWNQPDVLFQPGVLSAFEIKEWPQNLPLPQLYPDSVLTRKKLGGALSFCVSYNEALSKVKYNLEAGYKTEGYLPGEALRQAPILRGGFSANF